MYFEFYHGIILRAWFEIDGKATLLKEPRKKRDTAEKTLEDYGCNASLP